MCKHFNDGIARKVFTDICVEEILSGREVPQYKQISKQLTDAINKITRKTKQKQFEWLPEPSTLAKPQKKK